jgi:hypothetical protein
LRINAEGSGGRSPEVMTMIVLRPSQGFARVSRRRPCRVCGKPDWCSYTRDEQVSICMRVHEGARRINRHGGAIFVHNHDSEASFLYLHQQQGAPVTAPAPVKVRDVIYQTLIRLSPAACYRKELIEDVKGLRARGFAENHLAGYGALPPQARERDRLAQQILRTVNESCPEITTLCGIPGFWRDHDGWHLWTRADYAHPKLLIPCRDSDGLIRACQLRSPGFARNRLRYCWLSSKDRPEGTSSGSPLHFTFQQSNLPPDASIIIVEGLLKADALVALRPHLFAVATSGVAANHELLIDSTRGRRVILAVDQDYLTNPAVCLSLAALLARRCESEHTLDTTRIACWPTSVKGIDDAAVRRLPIGTVGVDAWLRQLGAAGGRGRLRCNVKTFPLLGELLQRLAVSRQIVD